MKSPFPILLTGGAQRIGHYCALRLAENGYPVIVTYRRERPGLAELRNKGITTLQADFGHEASIETFIRTLKARTGQLRAIIHNASEWLPDTQPADGETLTRLFQTHMLAPYLINQHCAPLLQHGGPADIIHIGDAVTRKGSEDHIAYSACKAGLENLTRSFARKLAPGIKVNTLQPAMIQFNEGDDASYRQKALDKSLLGIAPGPQAVYQAICYLLESDYITGTELLLNGGRHLR